MENEDQIEPEASKLPPVEVVIIPDINLYLEVYHDEEPL